MAPNTIETDVQQNIIDSKFTSTAQQSTQVNDSLRKRNHPNGTAPNGSIPNGSTPNGTVRNGAIPNGGAKTSERPVSNQRDAGFSDGVFGVVWTTAKLLAVLPVSLLHVLHSTLRTFTPRCFKRRSVKGEVVLVTGGGSGLGRRLASMFAAEGATVVVWGRNEQNLQQTVAEVAAAGGSCEYAAVDVTDCSAVNAAADEVLRRHGKVDVLVNNAGVVNGMGILEMNEAKIVNSFNVNVISHFYTVRRFLPGMMSSNSGQVVTVSSCAGLDGVNRMTDYCASKYAAVGFSESLSEEMRCNGYDGITVTLICPYYFDSGMFEGVKSSLLPVMTSEYVANETYDAIVMNSRYCIIPWITSIVISLISGLPPKVADLFTDVFGTNQSLNTFRGSKYHK